MTQWISFVDPMAAELPDTPNRAMMLAQKNHNDVLFVAAADDIVPSVCFPRLQ
jgi:hypothetical protein